MERMFFLLPEPDEEETATIAKGLSVFIGITGKPRYRLTLLYERALADAMLKNALGTPVSDAMMKRCILEATNIIAGNFLQHWDDSRERNITLPDMDKGKVFDRFIPRETIFSRYVFEGMSLEVHVESGEEG